MVNNRYVHILLMLMALMLMASAQDIIDIPPPNIDYACSLCNPELHARDTAIVMVTVKLPTDPRQFVFDTLPAPPAMGMGFIKTVTQTRTVITPEGRQAETDILLHYLVMREGQIRIDPWRWNLLHITGIDSTGDSIVVLTDTIPMQFEGYRFDAAPARVTFEDIRPYLFGLLGLLIFVLITAVLLGLAKRHRNRPRMPVRPPTPEEIAVAALDELSLARMKTDDIVTAISRTVRQYIESKYGIPAKGLPSAEIMERVSEMGMGGNRFVALRDILGFCDDVQFASRYVETAEIERLVKLARQFITNDWRGTQEV